MKKFLLAALMLFISTNVLAFGAGAYDGDRAAAVSGNFETLAEAQKAALEICGQGCKLFLDEFSNSCTVIVEGERGLSYSNNNEQIYIVKNLAMQQCQSSGNKNCSAVVGVCDEVGKARLVRTVGNVKPVQNNTYAQYTKPGSNNSENSALKQPETKNLPYVSLVEPTIFINEEELSGAYLRYYKSENIIYPDGVICNSFRNRTILKDGRPESNSYRCVCKKNKEGDPFKTSGDSIYDAHQFNSNNKYICSTVEQYNALTANVIESAKKEQLAKEQKKAEIEVRRKALKQVCKGRPKYYQELIETMSRQIGVHPNSISLESVFVDETVFGPNCVATFYTSKGAVKKVVYFDSKGIINQYDDGSGTFLNFLLKN